MQRFRDIWGLAMPNQEQSFTDLLFSKNLAGSISIAVSK